MNRRISFSLPAVAHRNPLATAARLRHAGRHAPAGGAPRQQARRALQRELAGLGAEHRHSP